jgi:hypothetical protein
MSKKGFLEALNFYVPTMNLPIMGITRLGAEWVRRFQIFPRKKFPRHCCNGEENAKSVDITYVSPKL